MKYICLGYFEETMWDGMSATEQKNYMSPDGGDNWEAIARDLPSVFSVEVQTLP